MGLQIPMVMPIQVQRFAPKSNDLTRKNLKDRDGSLKFSRQNKICKVQNLFTPCIGSNECAQLTRRNQFRGMSVMHASICIGCRIWHHNTALQFLRNTWIFYIDAFLHHLGRHHHHLPPSFSGSLYFFLMFQPYRELVLKHVFNIFNYHSKWQSNQPWHYDRMFSQIVYVMKEPMVSISIHVLNSI